MRQVQINLKKEGQGELPQGKAMCADTRKCNLPRKTEKRSPSHPGDTNTNEAHVGPAHKNTSATLLGDLKAILTL